MESAVRGLTSAFWLLIHLFPQEVLTQPRWRQKLALSSWRQRLCEKLQQLRTGQVELLNRTVIQPRI